MQFHEFLVYLKRSSASTGFDVSMQRIRSEFKLSLIISVCLRFPNIFYLELVYTTLPYLQPGSTLQFQMQSELNELFTFLSFAFSTLNQARQCNLTLPCRTFCYLS